MLPDFELSFMFTVSNSGLSDDSTHLSVFVLQSCALTWFYINLHFSS